MEANLKSRFLSLFCMVLADGIIDAKEMETLYRIGTDKYGLSPEEIARVVMEAGTSFFKPSTLEEKISLLYQLGEIAWADGEIQDSEILLMKRYAQQFGFEESNITGIIDYILQVIKEGISEEEVIQSITNN